MTDSNKPKYDTLQMYFREDYPIDEKIIIRQPSIGDILESGEKFFFSSLYTFIGNPTTYRLQLWELGLDWNKISDFDLFCSLVPKTEQKFSDMIFNGLDFSLFEGCTQTKDGVENIVLYDPVNDIIINEEKYNQIKEYLQALFNIYPKVEKARDKTTKEWMIQEERDKLKKETQDAENSSMLFPLISACVNHPGFKYKLQELRDVGIFEFMDCVSRLQIYESSTALLKGMYSGFVDASKIDDSKYNFMREIK